MPTGDLQLRLPEGFGYKARPLVTDDAEAVNALTTPSSEQGTPDASSYERIHKLLTVYEERLVTDSRAVFCADQLVAVVLVFVPPIPGDEPTVSLLGALHPDHVKRGLESSLSQWVVSRVRMAKNDKGNPNRIRASCDPTKLSCVRLLEGLGFEPVRYFYRLSVDLQKPIQETLLSSQINLIPWTPTHSAAAREAFNTAFRGHWGLPVLTQTMWEKGFVGAEQFRAELSLLAMNGPEVIGVCINWVRLITEDARTPQGWIEAIGVVPEWRGCGVADAMLVHSLNAFLDEGLSQAALDVDTQNLSGALRLYEKHGLTPIRRTTMFERSLD
jgi:ribosomal protein S18 acetylase RimI-like enzyme